MKEFSFNGDWRTTIESNWLCKLRSDKFYKPDSHLEWRRNLYKTLHSGKVVLHITDEINENIEPEKEQSNTINYILNNEEKIFNKIYEVFKNNVIKYFLSYEHYPMEDQTFHLIKSIEELPNHLGLNEISISNCYKDGYALYVLNFEFDGDDEHGLCMVFQKDEFLRHDEIGGLSFEGLIDKIEYDDLVRRWNIRPDKKFYPLNSKYKKNKPWRQRANESYIKHLLHEKDNKEIIKLINEGKIIKDEKIGTGHGSLFEFAAGYGNHEILDYLFEREWNPGQAVAFCTRGQFRKETINLLVQKGANIDTFTIEGHSPLYNEIYNYAQAKSNFKYQKHRDQQRAEKHLEEIKKHRDQIEFLFQLGANPSQCDQEGNSYKVLLLKRWNEDYMKSSGTFKELDEIFNPSKWKFWRN